MNDSVRIVPGRVEDVPVILSLIRGLADYEKLSHQLVATEADLERSLFGPRPMAEVVIAWDHDVAVGFALFFHNFSTFQGHRGIYLEDLFVLPEHRGHGVGLALLRELAAICGRRGCKRMEWAVLDWNESAIGFYEGLDARPMGDWIIYRLSGDSLTRLAG